MKCTACTTDGARCSNDVGLALRNLPIAIQRDLHGALQHKCSGKQQCCQICTTHAREAFRRRYGPLFLSKGIDVANMAFVTMMELLSCQLFSFDASACEEFMSVAQGVQNRWGV